MFYDLKNPVIIYRFIASFGDERWERERTEIKHLSRTVIRMSGELSPTFLWRTYTVWKGFVYNEAKAVAYFATFH